MAGGGKPMKSFGETYRTAFGFLSSPCNIWKSDRIEDRRAVLKLAFADRLPYVRGEGYRTAKISMLFKLLGDVQMLERGMVRAVGIEPTLCHQNRILSPARLPVPPRPQRLILLHAGGSGFNTPGPDARGIPLQLATDRYARRCYNPSMEPAPHILVLDDDREIRELLGKFLEKQGLRVTLARDARELRKVWPLARYSLVVLDLMLPGESGLDVARWLRGQSNIPIVMLTAMGEETDRIVGLELGADDYMAKPFNPRELLARIRAVLRRAEGAQAATQNSEEAHASIRFAGWVLEPARRRLVNPQGAEVPLTGGEYELLTTLLERPNRVLTRDMLMDLLHNRQPGPFDRAIDVAVSRLRRKLEDDGRNPSVIKTVRGGGYVLSTTVEKAAAE
jgi:two-component system, OmpR family, response regulator